VPTPMFDSVSTLQRLVDAWPENSSGGGRSITVGLVGRGIQASRSPIMHEREGARLGIRYRYVLIDFDQLGLPDQALGDVVAAAERLGFAGLNITYPFKQAIIPSLTGLADVSGLIGAVNTVVFSSGQRIGHNTDSGGFADSFAATMADCSLGYVLQLGAGGAGMAVGHALLTLGAIELLVFDIDRQRAQHLAKILQDWSGRRVEALPSPDSGIDRADGIVNTTPVGMTKHPGLPLRAELLSPRHWVAEVVYFPPETELIRHARALGCRTMTGTGMAIQQAVLSFELFAGVSADRAAMSEHFEAAA
jgi:shikimate dehydrogenase